MNVKGMKRDVSAFGNGPPFLGRGLISGRPHGTVLTAFFVMLQSSAALRLFASTNFAVRIPPQKCNVELISRSKSGSRAKAWIRPLMRAIRCISVKYAR